MQISPVATIIAALSMVLSFTVPPYIPSGAFCAESAADELWRQELMDICSKTDEAMSFSKEELKILLRRGEKIMPTVEALEETPRKVYHKRLQKCLGLYSFVLETKEAEMKTPP